MVHGGFWRLGRGLKSISEWVIAENTNRLTECTVRDCAEI